jgi:cellulose synthase/poly-beta-1,6-N-acetylglucosamine synthase-like glycosyltransferase
MTSAALLAYAYAIWNLWKWLDVVKEAMAFDLLSRGLNKKAQAFVASSDLPKVSVIIPACNEERAILKSLESHHKQTYSNLEVIVVNGRSTDGTGEIIADFCKKKPSFQMIEVEQLPKGWLGKNHAMHLGSQIANGDYLLFTDADVVFAPDTL